jgi:radical SAM family uncharacterized protein
MSDGLDRVLRRVEKPARYTGGEWNARRKDPQAVKVRVALAFPDVYEVGMSYLGQKILYAILNERPHIQAERVFAPWPDFESELRTRGLPLFSLETATPIGQFDIVGFSLLYELNATNILTMLELGRIPLDSAERTGDDPFIIAGGPSAFNPEPVADLFDLFLIGDGEEAFPEIVERLIELKRTVRDRRRILEDLARIPGVYVPSLYETYRPDGSSLLAVKAGPGAPPFITKRIVPSFRDSFFPEDIVVPNIQAVFDRVAVEAARGCPQKCRFCQATTLYHPFRAKSPTFILKTMTGSLRATGYEDASLTALSLSDYPHLDALVRKAMAELEPEKVSLSLSSLRPKGVSADVVQNILKVRKTGLTLVPEAGTERLRRVINKHLDDADILDAARSAFRHGWRLLKLYFMIGLPTERDEDLEAIADLVEDIIEAGRAILKSPPRLNLSVSSFIPKPHTPFQWLAMDRPESLREKQAFLKGRLKRYRFVDFKDHPVEKALLEAVFARGDRPVGRLLRTAWERGARFDSWKDRFQVRFWDEAFALSGLDRGNYLGALALDAPLPWDHIDTGVKKDFLREELRKALAEERTPSCLERTCAECRGCGLPAFLDRSSEEPAPDRGDPLPRIGRASAQPLRYRLFYSKTGRARLLSHIDLINVIQRTFRRAGLSVAMTEGFHPKMIVSFLPALPLGMEAKRDCMDFKSRAVLSAEDALRHLNASVPDGIRFLELQTLAEGEPPLSRAVHSLVYSLDLDRAEAEEAVRTACAGKGIPDGPLSRRLSALIPRYLDDKGEDYGVQIRLSGPPERLILIIRQGPGKPPRPQDIVLELLNLEDQVYDMAREEIQFRPSSPPPAPTRPN